MDVVIEQSEEAGESFSAEKRKPLTAAEIEEINAEISGMDFPADLGCTPPNLIPYKELNLSLMDETGEFLLCYYGAQMALGFKGDLPFINRCYNWAENTGVIGRGATLHWFYGENGKLGYVCPQNKGRIRDGLILQFRSEIIRSKAVSKLKSEFSDDEGLSVEYDEETIQRLAEEKADLFLKNRVRSDSFLVMDSTGMGPVYDYSPPMQRLGDVD